MRAIARTLRALASADDLPSPVDARVAIPPVRTAWVRRVAGFNLWLIYDVRPDGSIIAMFVVNTPPIPID